MFTLSCLISCTYVHIHIYTHIKYLCCLMQYSMIMKDLNELKWFDIIVSNWKEKSSYRWEKWVKDENRSPGHTLQSCYDDWNRCMSVVTFDRSELVNVGKTQKTDLVQDFFFRSHDFMVCALPIYQELILLYTPHFENSECWIDSIHEMSFINSSKSARLLISSSRIY